MELCYNSVENFERKLFCEESLDQKKSLLDSQNAGISEPPKAQCFWKEATCFNDEWKATIRK